MNRVLMQAARQPGAALPASRQDHFVIVVTAGLGMYCLHELLVTDEAACLAANCLQMPHGSVHAVLRGGIDVVARLGAVGYFAGACWAWPVAAPSTSSSGDSFACRVATRDSTTTSHGCCSCCAAR